MIVEAGIDFSEKRNLIVASVILVIRRGAKIQLGSPEVGEMSLATYVGVLLNPVLPPKAEAA